MFRAFILKLGPPQRGEKELLYFKLIQVEQVGWLQPRGNGDTWRKGDGNGPELKGKEEKFPRTER